MAARSRRPSAVILSYHNVVPRGESTFGDRSLHVDQATFGDHLDVLLRTHEIVPLGSLATRLGERPSGGSPPLAVITFDDAYRGAMTAGIAELVARGLPCTVFVPPGLLGAPGFWWDMLATEEGLDPAVRHHALHALQGKAIPVLQWAEAQGIALRALPEHARPATEELLLSAAAAEGVSLGAHTWAHPNLAELPLSEAREECERSRSWLRAKAPRYVDWLAYPYGLYTSEVAAEAGEIFDGALRVEGGLAYANGAWARRRSEVPRVNVSRGVTEEGLVLRVAGLLT